MTTKKNLDKFTGNKPLIECVNNYYPDKYMIQYHEFEDPKEFDLWEAIKGERLPYKEYKIVFGINAIPEEFNKFDFLWCPDGPAFVVHKRVLDKFNELCPKDIQALSVTIKNLNDKMPKFEDKNFYLINILNIRDVIDRDKSEAYYRGDFLEFKEKMYLKDLTSLGASLLARVEEFTPKIVFHPSLAKHFIKSKGIQFFTDEEAPI